MFLDVPDFLFFKLFLHAVLFPSIFASAYFSRLQRCSALLLFVFIRSLRSCGIAAAALPPAFIAALPPAFTAALPPKCIHTAALPPVCSGTAASIHAAALPPVCSGTAAMRHCRQYIMQRHCRHAACTHSGIAASMRSQRQCRQHALFAALPPASTHMQRHCRHSV